MEPLIEILMPKRRGRKPGKVLDNKYENIPKDGWRIREWVHATGISRSRVYELISEKKIRTAKVDQSRIILTDPRGFLESYEE